MLAFCNFNCGAEDLGLAEIVQCALVSEKLKQVLTGQNKFLRGQKRAGVGAV
jgi:hypothetical protein